MRKFLAAFAAVCLATIAFAGAAGAQDAHVGNIESDPALVPEAGEYTLTATGTGWLPDTSILLVSCVSPADTLVPGVSSEDEIVAAALAIDALADCDIANAVPIEVDGDGNFSAGALDGSQAGATWVPIVDPAAAAALADTGVETGLLAVIGGAVLGAGVMIAREARRHR